MVTIQISGARGRELGKPQEHLSMPTTWAVYKTAHVGTKHQTRGL